MSRRPFEKIWDQHVVREFGGGRAPFASISQVHDVNLLMALTVLLTVFAVCAGAVPLKIDRSLRRRL